MSIWIANMAEISFLVELGNEIEDMGIRPTAEGSLFMVCLSGSYIENDHSDYLQNPVCYLSRLHIAFEAIEKWRRSHE